MARRTIVRPRPRPRLRPAIAPRTVRRPDERRRAPRAVPVEVLDVVSGPFERIVLPEPGDR